MTAAARLRAEAANRVLVKDGAYGTLIQERRLDDYGGSLGLQADQRGNNDLLNLTRPDVVLAIHGAYLDAGADIIETNTFTANALAQSDYGLTAVVREMNVEAARLEQMRLRVAHRDLAPAARARMAALSMTASTRITPWKA